MSAADFEEDICEVWPDNWMAVQAFIAMGTQWRIGATGHSGLEYQSLPFVLRMNGAPRAEWPELFSQIRVLERVALEELSK